MLLSILLFFQKLLLLDDDNESRKCLALYSQAEAIQPQKPHETDFHKISCLECSSLTIKTQQTAA